MFMLTAMDSERRELAACSRIRTKRQPQSTSATSAKRYLRGCFRDRHVRHLAPPSTPALRHGFGYVARTPSSHWSGCWEISAAIIPKRECPTQGFSDLSLSGNYSLRLRAPKAAKVPELHLSTIGFPCLRRQGQQPYVQFSCSAFKNNFQPPWSNLWTVTTRPSCGPSYLQHIVCNNCWHTCYCF